MLQDFWEMFSQAIGINEVDPVMSTWQIIPRVIVVYLVALVLIRIGKRRFLGGYTAFDLLLGFVVGSIMSRAITGAISFVNMIFIVATLVALHWVISIITYYYDTGGVLKNEERRLIKDGEIDEEAMRKSKIGKNDLMQAMRAKGKVDDVKDVEAAYLERDGNITVIPRKREPKIVEVNVEEGVQSVKILIQQ